METPAPKNIRITYFDGTKEHDLYRADEHPDGWHLKAVLDLPQIQALLVDDKALHSLFFLGAEVAALKPLHRQRPMQIDPEAESICAYLPYEVGETVWITLDGHVVGQMKSSDQHQQPVLFPMIEGEPVHWVVICDLTRHYRMTTGTPKPPTVKQLSEELDRCGKAQVTGKELADALCLEHPTTAQMRDVAEEMRWWGWESYKTRTGTAYRRHLGTMTATHPDAEKVIQWLSGAASHLQQVTEDEVLDALKMRGKREPWHSVAAKGLMEKLGWGYADTETGRVYLRPQA